MEFQNDLPSVAVQFLPVFWPTKSLYFILIQFFIILIVIINKNKSKKC